MVAQKGGSGISVEEPTRRLEVEAPELDGISGMVERHLFAIGKAAFPGLRLSPFSNTTRNTL